MWGVFNTNYSFMGNQWAMPFWWGLGFLLMLWVLAWKGYALWIAARKGHKGWFVALLVLNTMAILEILYIYVFSEPTKTNKTNKPSKTTVKSKK